jgi:hypothetical protein
MEGETEANDKPHSLYHDARIFQTIEQEGAIMPDERRPL